MYCLLSIALRTGRNLSSLLEMRVDCLRPHFKAGMKLLVVTKRRSATYPNIPVRAAQAPGDAIVGVMPDTARLIERVIELSEPYRNDAPDKIRHRLWLFRSRAKLDRGRVTHLTSSHFTVPARSLSEMLDLQDDDGTRLTVNTARLRKPSRIGSLRSPEVIFTQLLLQPDTPRRWPTITT